ncbi:MAG: fibronectin type III domain-containing protein [Nitrospirae bacterium]|nr:fibronectin type III domain-containing protein [Nitrospirota bacterium]
MNPRLASLFVVIALALGAASAAQAASVSKVYLEYGFQHTYDTDTLWGLGYWDTGTSSWVERTWRTDGCPSNNCAYLTTVLIDVTCDDGGVQDLPGGCFADGDFDDPRDWRFRNEDDTANDSGYTYWARLYIYNDEGGVIQWEQNVKSYLDCEGYDFCGDDSGDGFHEIKFLNLSYNRVDLAFAGTMDNQDIQTGEGSNGQAICSFWWDEGWQCGWWTDAGTWDDTYRANQWRTVNPGTGEYYQDGTWGEDEVIWQPDFKECCTNENAQGTAWIKGSAFDIDWALYGTGLDYSKIYDASMQWRYRFRREDWDGNRDFFTVLMYLHEDNNNDGTACDGTLTTFNSGEAGIPFCDGGWGSDASDVAPESGYVHAMNNDGPSDGAGLTCVESGTGGAIAVDKTTWVNYSSGAALYMKDYFKQRATTTHKFCPEFKIRFRNIGGGTEDFDFFVDGMHVYAYVDWIEPTTSIAPNGQAWGNANVAFTLTPADTRPGDNGGTIAGAVGYTCWSQVEDGSACPGQSATCSGWNSGTSGSATCSAGSTCRRRICYYSVDDVGNMQSTQTSNVYYIDKTVPSTAIIAPIGADTVAVVSDGSCSCSWTGAAGASCSSWWQDELKKRGLNVTAVTAAQIDTLAEMQAYKAILNPYGEYYPETSGETVLNLIRQYANAGGFWFEAGGWNFYYSCGAAADLNTAGDDRVCVDITSAGSAQTRNKSSDGSNLVPNSAATAGTDTRPTSATGMTTGYSECTNNPRLYRLYEEADYQSGPSMHCYGKGCVVRTDAVDSATPDIYAELLRYWHKTNFNVSGLDYDNLGWGEDALPPGATQGDTWAWSGATKYTGTQANYDNNAGNPHQHYFSGASETITVPSGGWLYQWIYVPSTSVPTEVMLQFNDADWEQRAYWGANSIAWGTDGTCSRRSQGSFPAQRDQWVPLAVDATTVCLDNVTLNGWAYTLYNNSTYFDHTGAFRASTRTVTSNVTVTVNGADRAPFGTYSVSVGAGLNCRDQGSNLCDVKLDLADHVNNTATMTKEYGADWTIPTCSVSITEGTSAAYQYATGATVYYNNAVAGDFTVNSGAADATAGVAYVNFPAALQTATANVIQPAAFNKLYSWTSDTASATPTMTVYDKAANSTTCTFTYTYDNTAPSGGSVSYSNTFTSSTSASVSFVNPTDGGSGVAGRLVQRRSGTLSAGSCSGYGSWSTISTDPGSSPVSDTGLTTGCYQYRYVVTDNVNNSVTYCTDGTGCASLNEYKVDTTAPTSPTSFAVVESGDRTLKLTWTGGSDGESGIQKHVLYRCTPSCGAPGSLLVDGSTSACYDDGTGDGNCTDNGQSLSANTKYCYTVRAVNNAGTPETNTTQICAAALKAHESFQGAEGDAVKVRGFPLSAVDTGAVYIGTYVAANGNKIYLLNSSFSLVQTLDLGVGSGSVVGAPYSWYDSGTNDYLFVTTDAGKVFKIQNTETGDPDGTPASPLSVSAGWPKVLETSGGTCKVSPVVATTGPVVDDKLVYFGGTSDSGANKTTCLFGVENEDAYDGDTTFREQIVNLGGCTGASVSVTSTPAVKGTWNPKWMHTGSNCSTGSIHRVKLEPPTAPVAVGCSRSGLAGEIQAWITGSFGKLFFGTMGGASAKLYMLQNTENDVACSAIPPDAYSDLITPYSVSNSIAVGAKIYWQSFTDEVYSVDVGGRLYCVCQTGNAPCTQGATCNANFPKMLESGVPLREPLIVNGIVYLISNSGKLYAVEALCDNESETSCSSTDGVAPGTLVGGNEGYPFNLGVSAQDSTLSLRTVGATTRITVGTNGAVVYEVPLAGAP